jgi:mRNA-degrading endonuclease RelE of RelBE toxin-antitoxin system
VSKIFWNLNLSKESKRRFAYLEKKELEIAKITAFLLTELRQTEIPEKHPKVKLLTSKKKTTKVFYRLRIDSYRLIFTLCRKKHSIFVEIIDRRNNVYRWFNRNY